MIDETWSDLALDEVPRTPPMAAFDTDSRMITIGSASKLWWGGLRIGWVRTTAATVRRLAVLRGAWTSPARCWNSSWWRGCSTGWRRPGRAPPYARASRDALSPGWRSAARMELHRAQRRRLVLGAAARRSSAALADAAAHQGVRLAPGPWFGLDGTLEGRLRLPYTHPPQVLVEAVSRIAAAQSSERLPGTRPRSRLASCPLTRPRAWLTPGLKPLASGARQLQRMATMRSPKVSRAAASVAGQPCRSRV